MCARPLHWFTMTFRLPYCIAAVALFLLEVAIARGLGGPLVRGSVGDILVVVLLHCALRACTRLRPAPAALLATAAGFVVEGLQALHLADRLGLAPGSVGAIVIGTTASLGDLAMYLLGGLLALAGDTLTWRMRRIAAP